VIFFLANTALRARIDQRTKEEAAVVPATIGLTVSDAFRLMMMRIAKDKALPFEPLVPNAETGEAMRAARRNKVMSAGTPDKLLSSVSVND
jgi:DNA-damage-inducible protein J